MAFKEPEAKIDAQLVECWQLNIDEESEQFSEFRWSRQDGTMPGCQDVRELLEGVSLRQKEVKLAAADPECAFHLLFSIIEAHAVPRFSRREVAVTAADLVAEALTARFGGEIAGCDAEVVIDEDSSLALHLRLLDDDQTSELITAQADRIEALLKTAASDLEQKLLKNNCLTLGRSGRGEDPKVAGYVSWAALGPSVIDIIDELNDEERCQGVNRIADSARSHSFVDDSVEDGDEDPGITVVIPLGHAGHTAENPIISAMSIAALAALSETLIGGREVDGRALRSIQVRGHRGCAVKFIHDTPCTMT